MSETGVRNAFVASGVGMVAVLVFVLILATTQPQGTFQPADDQQYRATLLAATDDLEGYELIGEDRARIDIARAMDLVAERGVDLSLTAVGAPAASAMPAEPAAQAEGADETDVAADDQAEAAPDDQTAADDAAPAAQADAPEVDGEAVYASNCTACHQATGQGIPGAFPPLAGGHAAELASVEGGRDYLIHAMLYGVQGQLVVNGTSYSGVMPAWQQLSDGQISAVLNYVTTAWDNEDALADDVAPFTPDQIAAARGEGLSASDVLESRPELP
ncbi:MAG: cytochrome c [Trueperaceae bacterium]|nr:cytochrome c [Trueperaceae bacterium]